MAKKNLWETIKALFPWAGLSAEQAKALRFGAIIVLAGILFILLGGLGKDKKITGSLGPKESVIVDRQTLILLDKKKEELAKDLARILSHIKGVGRVEVELTLDTGPIQIYEFNRSEEVQTLEEKDSDGGERNQEQKTRQEQVAIYRDAGGQEKPMLIKEIQPMVRGVLIVAEGAEDLALKADLARAASRVLGIPLHKVMVLPY